MKLGVRAKLFVALLILIVVSLGAAEIYLRSVIERDLVERIRSEMAIRLALVAEEARNLAATADEESLSWDELADRLGPLSHARVTFIDHKGVVRGDSEVSSTDLMSLENHGNRPEFQAAQSGRIGDSMRYSTTLHTRLLYTAMLVPGSTGMVARLAQPLANVDRAVAHLRTFLYVGGLVALLVAVFLSSGAAVLLSRTLRQLTALARRMAAGELDLRSHMDSQDEVGELARALDQLVQTLSCSLRELRDDRDLLGRILEAMREGVLVLDSERRILLFNASLRETLLFDSSSVGRPAIEVVRNADLHALIDEALGGREPVSGEIEVIGLRPRRFLVHVTRLSGEPRCVLVVLFDVTELRRLETVRKDFVANVSHELRTPIASVLSAVETLQIAARTDPASVTNFVDMIERNARRLSDLVQDLLDLSRIEANEYHLACEKFELAGAVERVFEFYRKQAMAKLMELRTSLPEGLPACYTDPTALDHVLSNLIDNAIKYGSEGCTVIVSAENLGDSLRVTVSDDGPGIGSQHLPRLFERFYRCDPGRSRAMGGTGLGLSIVKHLVEAMGGTVQVESTVGQGSHFSFTVPAAR